MHGITLRDIGAVRLLATWAALAMLVRAYVDAATFATLVAPFRVVGGLES